MRISDWSSDVCSSDLREAHAPARHRIDLRHRGEFDRDVLGARHLQDRRRRIAVVIKLRVSEIAEHPDLILLRPGDEPFVEGEIDRSEEHTSELQSLMRISYAVFCLNKKIIHKK